MELKDLINEYEELLTKANKSLSGAPEGKLRVSKTKGSVRYYLLTEKGKHNGSYIKTKDGQNKNLIQALAQKEYDEKLIKVLTEDLKILKKAKQVQDRDNAKAIFGKLCKGKQQLVKQYKLSNDEYAAIWKKEGYYQKTFKAEDEFFVTNQGHKVRSKSECIIANRLFELGIPYRYEMRYELFHKVPGTNFVNRIVRFPDFTVLNKRTRKVIILEHFGLLDDENYRNGFTEKIELYEENGFLLGQSFVFTCETSKHALNTEHLNNIIKDYLL